MRPWPRGTIGYLQYPSSDVNSILSALRYGRADPIGAGMETDGACQIARAARSGPPVAIVDLCRSTGVVLKSLTIPLPCVFLHQRQSRFVLLRRLIWVFTSARRARTDSTSCERCIRRLR